MSPNSTPSHRRKPLGELLIEQGRITQAELDAALAFKQEHGLKLGHALVALHLVTQSQLAHALRAQGAVHCLQLSPGLVDRQVAYELGEDRSRQLEVVAINRIAGIVTIAIEDPSDTYVTDTLSIALDAPVFAVHAEPARIRSCLDHVFGAEKAPATVARVAPAQASSSPRRASGPHAPDADESRADEPLAQEFGGDEEPDEAEIDAAAVQLLASLLEEARAARATDVHLEPHRDDFVVRFRIAGELRDHASLARSWQAGLLRRLKTLAGLDVGEQRFPQDGKARTTIGEEGVELQVATAATAHGEGAVVHLLDGGQRSADLAALPLSERQRADLAHMITGDGLVLASGPTGQGRTTTLYALARRLDLGRRKLITIEDPPEDELAGAFQMQVQERAGMTMARALRGALQLDPDALLVGELRDRELAELALQAALAGRLVFSTLHAPGAAEAIVRLTDMGLEPFLLADALRGVVAQRLVRSLCRECRREGHADAGTLARLGLAATPARNFAAIGCEACSYTGWRGRIALYEVLSTDALWDALRTARPARELRELAQSGGFVTLREDGLAKAFDGHTTLDEVYAATARG